MSLEQKINTIQALALQSLTGKVDSLNPIMEGSVVFNPASGDNNIFTNNIQSQFNQNVFIHRNLTVSGTTFLKSKQVVYDVGTMLSNLNVFGDVVIKNGSLIDQEGTAYFDNISVATNLIARGGLAQMKNVEISDDISFTKYNTSIPSYLKITDFNNNTLGKLNPIHFNSNGDNDRRGISFGTFTVSYTHLTLPTKA